jgi:hypothetical protein
MAETTQNVMKDLVLENFVSLALVSQVIDSHGAAKSDGTTSQVNNPSSKGTLYRPFWYP